MINKHEEMGDCINKSKKNIVDKIMLEGIIKVSQILTSQVESDKLIENTLEIIVEYINATKVVLLMNNQEGLKVTSIWNVLDNTIRVFNDKESFHIDKNLIPMDIINFVQITQNKVLYPSNNQYYDFINDEYFKKNKSKSILCIPIVLNDKFQGIIYMENCETNTAFENVNIKILYVLLTQLFMTIENIYLQNYLEEKVKERTIELIKITEKYKKLSITDQLTGLLNRRELDNKLYEEFYKLKKHSGDLAIIILDIDWFKQINDKFGHHVGDIVLINLADLLKYNARPGDFVGRWGGEEFMIICPQTNADEVYALCEKIRKVIENTEIQEIGRVTASFGASVYMDDDSIVTFIKRVDKGLYKAKNSGRNKCVFN